MPDTAEKWEYQIMLITGDVTVGLNQVGAERWEMCGILGNGKQQLPNGQVAEGPIVVFKRPKSLIEMPKSKVSITGPLT